MTSDGVRHTVVVWAIAIFSVLVAWFVFKLVLHIIAALVTGIIVLAIALYLYFKFFRKTRAS
jgi:hypothetical protein